MGFFEARHVSAQIMKTNWPIIKEIIVVAFLLWIVIAAGVAGITLSWKLIGHLLGAH